MFNKKTKQIIALTEERDVLLYNNNALQQQISDLQQQNDNYKQQIHLSKQIIDNLNANNKFLKEKELDLSIKYRQALTDNDTIIEWLSHDDVFNLDVQLKGLRLTFVNLLRQIQCNKEIAYKKNLIKRMALKKNELVDECTQLRDQIEILDEEKMYQDFGLYEPKYNLMNSLEYKDRIKLCRNKQKEMVKNKTAAINHTDWYVNNSKVEGNKMINRNIKQIVRCFNSECDALILKVKYNNYYSIENRIYKSFNILNELHSVNQIELTSDYLALKLEELALCYEYEEKKQEEKEYARMIREEEREQAKLLKEIEEERKKIKKEQEHYTIYLKHINEQIEIEQDSERLQFLYDKLLQTENTLQDLDLALQDIDYREANQKAGYVYIISNIGTFGENIYKIGMTRRLNPQDRIDELGGASVPFKFDIHAMIFSDNAPALENALHKAFESKRVNMTNNRKEFFNVSLNEIKDVINKNYDKTVDFIDIPSAQQYRETLKIKELST